MAMILRLAELLPGNRVSDIETPQEAAHDRQDEGLQDLADGRVQGPGIEPERQLSHLLARATSRDFGDFSQSTMQLLPQRRLK